MNERASGPRDLAKNPILYEFKARNAPVMAGSISSEGELLEVIETALEAYKTEDLSVALKRVGRGICPKSFPISSQSLYFLRLYDMTHGGEAKAELMHLPNEGGVLDQPYLFYQASDIIKSIRITEHNKDVNESLDKVHRESASREGDTRPKNIAAGR